MYFPRWFTGTSVSLLLTMSIPTHASIWGNDDRPTGLYCETWPLLGVNGTGPLKTCDQLKPGFNPNGTVAQWNVWGGSYFTDRTPGMGGPGTSKCRDIYKDAIKAQSPFGDFLVWYNSCTNGTGWDSIKVFDKYACPGSSDPTVKTMTFDVVRNFPTEDEWHRGKYFCLRPGFVVKSFFYYKRPVSA